MKKRIIYVTIVIIIFLVIVLLFYLNNKESENVSNIDKKYLLQNVLVENESILTNQGNINLEGNIKNNNSEDIKIKMINVSLINNDNEVIKKVKIKLNKTIEPRTIEKFSKMIKIDETEERIFTEYSFEI